MATRNKTLNGYKYLVCVVGVFIFIWLLHICNRINRLEAELDRRAVLVTKFLEVETRVLNLEREQVEIEKHHQELLELINIKNEKPNE